MIKTLMMAGTLLTTTATAANHDICISALNGIQAHITKADMATQRGDKFDTIEYIRLTLMDIEDVIVYCDKEYLNIPFYEEKRKELITIKKSLEN